ncbi:MAG: hypothetical protein ACK6BG_03680 [Cyanobacteriota bacterium]
MTEKNPRLLGLENRLSDFYKEHYFNELKRREELTGRIALPLGILSILIGSIVAAFREINRPDTLNEYLIVILLICAVFPACMVIINLWRSYHNNRYWVIDTPAQIMSYKNKLLVYYEDPGIATESAPAEEAILDVLAYIDQEYAKHADYNSRVRDRRSYFLTQANVYLAVTLAVATLALVLQLTRLASLPEQPQKVKIVNIREVSMPTPSGKPVTPANGAGSVSNNNLPKQPVPQKPLPTGGRLIRGDVDPGQVR